jgi:hypothetical protein
VVKRQGGSFVGAQRTVDKFKGDWVTWEVMCMDVVCSVEYSR